MKRDRADRAQNRQQENRKFIVREVEKELKARNIHLNRHSFVSRSESADFTCLDCGHTWSTIVKSTLKMKHGCQMCAARKTSAQKCLERLLRVKEEMSETNFEILSDTAITQNDLIKIRCKVCGIVTQSTPLRVLHKRKSCKHCGDGRKSFSKEPTTIGGKLLELAGYEEQAVRWLLAHGVSIRHINTDSLPRFKYEEHGTMRTYTPDFTVRSKVIEVKSTWTFGLGSSKILRNVQRKAKSVLLQGLKFELFLMTHDGRKLRIPKDWINTKRQALIKQIEDLNPTVKLYLEGYKTRQPQSDR